MGSFICASIIDIDHEVESSFSCPVDDTDVTKAEQDNSTSNQNPDFLHCTSPLPFKSHRFGCQVTTKPTKVPADQPGHVSNMSKHEVLNQFAEVMLANTIRTPWCSWDYTIFTTSCLRLSGWTTLGVRDSGEQIFSELSPETGECGS